MGDPTVNFVLFHGSFPYSGELTTIAKYLPNAFIDMCWLYVISPSYYERFLHEWIETVPASKIMGFGGDYLNIENAYSHLMRLSHIANKTTKTTRNTEIINLKVLFIIIGIYCY
jgi:predicted TIM-barrel fold metal-dependent hydrolase